MNHLQIMYLSHRMRCARPSDGQNSRAERERNRSFALNYATIYLGTIFAVRDAMENCFLIFYCDARQMRIHSAAAALSLKNGEYRLERYPVAGARINREERGKERDKRRRGMEGILTMD